MSDLRHLEIYNELREAWKLCMHFARMLVDDPRTDKWLEQRELFDYYLAGARMIDEVLLSFETRYGSRPR